MVDSKIKIPIILTLFILAAIFTIAHGTLALKPAPILMKWFHIDDAFYYFQVARNVVNGKGFTFDGFGTSNGFHPLWMLINIPIFSLARFNPYLPFRVLLLVSAGITFLGGLVLFDLLRKHLHIEVALVGMAVWILYWPIQQIVTMTSMEAGINAFAILCFLWLIEKLNPRRALSMLILGLMATFVLFSRLDNIFLVLITGAWLVFYQRPMRSLLLVDIFLTFLTVFTSVILRVGAFESLHFLSASYIVLLAALLIKLVTFYFFGLYRWPSSYRSTQLLFRLVGATLTSSGLLISLSLILIKLGLIVNYPRSALLIDAVLTLVLLTASRFILRAMDSTKDNVNLSLKNNLYHWSSRGFLYLAPIGLLFGSYLLWNHFTFGTPMPVSGQIKQWWGTLLTGYGSHQKNIWTVIGIIPKSAHEQSPWFLIREILYDPVINLFNIKLMDQLSLYVTINITLTIIYALLAGFLFKKKGREFFTPYQALNLTPLLTASFLQPFYLSVIGYLAIRDWYYVMQIIASVLLFLLLINVLVGWLKSAPKRWSVAKFLPYIFIFILAIANIYRIQRYFPFKVKERDISRHLSTTRYLEENTPAGSVIGITGGGMDAYFIQDRTIVNLDGLINSKEYFDLMQAGKANLYLDRIGLDYVFSSAGRLLHTDPYSWYFSDRLRVIDHFGGITLFEYLSGQ